jgi:cardiolipin synthase/putative cardiolipin synthase
MDDVYDDFTVATTFNDPARVSPLASYFEARDGVQNVDRHAFDEILSPEPPLSRDEAAGLFTGLVRTGAATQRKSASAYADYEFAVESSQAATVLRQQVVALTYRNETAIEGTPTTAEVVATVPPNVSVPADTSWRRHSAELRSLLLNADERVRIAAPYFTPAESIVDDIASLPNRGVDTRVLTREARTNESTVEALGRIHDAVDPGHRENLRVRDLYELDAISGSQEYATHAKVIVSDDSVCYLGSANLTSTSLGSNFELGVVLTGDTVEAVSAIYDAVFDVASHVEPDSY